MERLRATLAGEPVGRPLNFDVMMTFAAHHAGRRLSEYYLDHRALVAANLAVVEDFGIDLVQAISDPYREATDLGSPVEFPDDGLPILKDHLLAERSDLSRLRLVEPEQGRRMSDRLAAVAEFASQVGGELPVLGWVEGPLAEAADLRGVSELMTDLYDDPDWVLELLELTLQQVTAFAMAQVEAGADIIGVGDAIASQISPRMYRRYALPFEQRLIAAIHECGALARLHICGDTSKLLADAATSGADIIDVDWMVPFGDAAAAFDGLGTCGNFDPVRVMLQGTPGDVFAATSACRAMGGPRFISMAGCEIPDGTPAANLHAQRRALDVPGAASGPGSAAGP
jgi:MtaA/CmuA family methyltransferase